MTAPTVALDSGFFGAFHDIAVHGARDTQPERSFFRVVKADLVPYRGHRNEEVEITNRTTVDGENAKGERSQVFAEHDVVFRIDPVVFRLNDGGIANGFGFGKTVVNDVGLLVERPKVAVADIAMREPQGAMVRMIVRFGDRGGAGVAKDVRQFGVRLPGRFVGDHRSWLPLALRDSWKRRIVFRRISRLLNLSPDCLNP